VPYGERLLVEVRLGHRYAERSHPRPFADRCAQPGILPGGWTDSPAGWARVQRILGLSGVCPGSRGPVRRHVIWVSVHWLTVTDDAGHVLVMRPQKAGTSGDVMTAGSTGGRALHSPMGTRLRGAGPRPHARKSITHPEGQGLRPAEDVDPPPYGVVEMPPSLNHLLPLTAKAITPEWAAQQGVF